MSEVEIGLNDYVMLQKEDTIVSGIIDGIKLNRGEIEKIYIEHLGAFNIGDDWKVVTEVEPDAEV